MNDSQEKEWNEKHFINPSATDNGKYVYYGLYPQTNVNDAMLVQKLNTLAPTDYNGYVCHNHEYYIKKTADLAYNGHGEMVMVHDFNNGNEIVDGSNYWFKVEPIMWRILSNNLGEKLLLSDTVIERIVFNHHDYKTEVINGITVYGNYYSNSNARRWLNDDFIDIAFAFNQSPIQTTLVDNSASTIPFPIDGWACENTLDKVFPLSFKDYTNPEYGFSEKREASSTRHFLTTDYARTVGVLYQDELYKEQEYYTAYCITRSPLAYEGDENTTDNICKVNKEGLLNIVGYSGTSLGVQPAMNIKI